MPYTFNSGRALAALFIAGTGGLPAAVLPTPGWTTLYFNNGFSLGAGDWTTQPGAVNPGVAEQTAMADPNYTKAAAQWTSSSEHYAPNNHVIQFKIGVPGPNGGTIFTARSGSQLFDDAVTGGPWHIHADYAISWGDPSAQPGVTTDYSVLFTLDLLNGPTAHTYQLIDYRVNYTGTDFYYGAHMEMPLSLDVYLPEAAMGFPEDAVNYKLVGTLTQSPSPGGVAVAQAWLDNILIEEQAVPEPGSGRLFAIGLLAICGTKGIRLLKHHPDPRNAKYLPSLG